MLICCNYFMHVFSSLISIIFLSSHQTVIKESGSLGGDTGNRLLFMISFNTHVHHILLYLGWCYLRSPPVPLLKTLWPVGEPINPSWSSGSLLLRVSIMGFFMATSSGESFLNLENPEIGPGVHKGVQMVWLKSVIKSISNWIKDINYCLQTLRLPEFVKYEKTATLQGVTRVQLLKFWSVSAPKDQLSVETHNILLFHFQREVKHQAMQVFTREAGTVQPMQMYICLLQAQLPARKVN